MRPTNIADSVMRAQGTTSQDRIKKYVNKLVGYSQKMKKTHRAQLSSEEVLLSHEKEKKEQQNKLIEKFLRRSYGR